MSISITDAVLAIKADAKIVVRGDDVDGIEWIDGETPISKSDILAKQTELQSEYDAKVYARTRAAAYPTIGDQLDMLWHAIDDNATLKTRYADFHTAIKAVKDANPKP